MANQPPGLNGLNSTLAYMGVNPTTPPNFKTYNRAPTENDSKNFLLGSLWEWQQEERVWILVSLAGGLATWAEIPFDAAQEFVTDSGTAIPLAGVLQILGGSLIQTEGSGNEVTISATGFVASEFNTDAGTARPILNVLNIDGGSNINTSGSGGTVTINLNQSISQPSTSADGTMGLYSLGGSDFISNFGTRNTFVGASAGNRTLTTSDSSTGIGASSLNALTTGNANTAIGNNSLSHLATGGGFNTALGAGTMPSLLTGEFNLAIGAASGQNYTGAESGNVLINNTGTVGESNTIRIGTQGSAPDEQNAAYMAGIYPVSPGPVPGVVFVGNDGKLGTEFGANGQVLIGSTGAAPVWSNLTAGANIAITNAANGITIAATGGGGGGTNQFFAYLPTSIASATGNAVAYLFGTGTAFTILYDIGGNCNAGGGGTAFSFTAPNTGYYTFVMSYRLRNVGAAHTGGTAQFQLAPGGGSPMSWEFYVGNPANNTEQVTGFLLHANSASCQAFLTAGNVMNFALNIDGGAQDVGIDGNAATGFLTYVSGYQFA